MGQVRYYVSFQGQIKDPWKWRIIRVKDGRHRTYWRVEKQREANDLVGFLQERRGIGSGTASCTTATSGQACVLLPAVEPS